MNKPLVIEKYIERRFPEAGEYYKKQWRERFNRNEEWTYSDYAGRHLLQELDPDFYPKDIDGFYPDYRYPLCLKTSCNFGTTGKCIYWDEENPIDFPVVCESEELQN